MPVSDDNMAKTEKNKGKKSRDSSKSKCNRTKKPGTTTTPGGIDKSQRLLRSTHETRARGKRPSNKKKENEIRNVLDHVCNKPMPPLSELEKMFDSDEEMTEQDIETSVVSQPPEQISSVIPNGSITPTTAKKYADEILKILDNLDTSTPLPVIPMKKYKKTEVPYIVGCTERPRIPENPNCNVFKGDDYGITNKTNCFNVDMEDELKKTIGFYMNPYSLSKSTFNAQANEIASKLLSTENTPVVHDTDSDDTVGYEVNSPKSRFSPEPSTSRDQDTIFKNDQKFRDSLLPLKNNNSDIDMYIEPIIDVGIVTEDNVLNKDIQMEDSNNIIEANSKLQSCPPAKENIDELVIDTDTPILDGSFDEDIEIIEQPIETITIDEDEIFAIDVKDTPNLHIKRESKREYNTDLIEILYEKPDVKVPVTTTNCSNTIQEAYHKNNSPINIEEYKFPDLKVIDEIDLTDMDFENVMLESQSLIDKYSKARTGNIIKACTPEPTAVDNTNKTILNLQLRSNNNPTDSLQKTINDQNLSNVNDDPNGLAQILKKYFDRINFPRYQSKRPNLSCEGRIFPQLFLTNSIDREEIYTPPYIKRKKIHEIILPDASLNNNRRRNLPQIRAVTPISRNERILPEVSLNNSVNSRRNNGISNSQGNRPNTSLGHERIVPEVSLNNSVNSRGNNDISDNQGNRSSPSFSHERILPEPPLAPPNHVDSPNQSKNKKRKRMSKKDNESTNLRTTSDTASPPSQPLGFGTCPICLHELAKGKIASTTCGHLFCLPCITRSLEFNKKCPACRKKLTARGYHPIYL